MDPVPGAVNVTFDLPLEPGFHGPLTAFFIRWQSLVRQIDQIQTVGRVILVAPGIPAPQGGPNQITYDGSLPTIKGTNGVSVAAFDLPILPRA